MKNKEFKNQIEGMIENYTSDFLDAYQCMNWGISAQKFAKILLKEFNVSLQQMARELDNEKWDDE